MTINTIICDDENSCIETIKKYLKKYCEEHNITCFCDCFNTSEEAIHSKVKYNIAFLDVEMGDINGLKIAERLKQKNKNIIVFFITDYEKYIDDAMNLFALRFLKKPLDYTRFYSGLDKAIELINEDVVEFYLKDSKKLLKIKSNEILYIETLSHKTKVVTVNGIYYSSDLIDFWEKKLSHTSFYRIHKSYILNLDYINEYQRIEVKLSNGDIIPVSYRNQTAFRKYFYDYLKRRK
ncbi:MAG: response regulator transcription factor [Eubacterium sp.]|nr:response regulator transcription factor [Eubacterium sp.]